MSYTADNGSTQVSGRARRFLVGCGNVAQAVLLAVFVPLFLFIVTAPFTAPVLRGYMPASGGWSWFTGGLPEHTIQRADEALYQFLFYLWIFGFCMYVAYRLLWWGHEQHRIANCLKLGKAYVPQQPPLSIVFGVWQFLAFAGVLLLGWVVLPLGPLPVLAVLIVGAFSCVTAIEWSM